MDFAVPWDKNVVVKEGEKMTKYALLAGEVRNMHGISTMVVPIVVGALDIVTSRLPDVLGGLQTSATVGTTIILRKALSL